MNNRQISPLFLIGYHRSGTTLISRLISNHQRVRLAVNGKLFYYLICWLYNNKTHLDKMHLRIDEIEYALRRKPVSGLNFDLAKVFVDTFKQLNEELEASPSTYSKAFLKELWVRVYKYELQKEVMFIGEKYNENLLLINILPSIFEDAKIIFIYRHPLDVSYSMLTSFREKIWAPKNVNDSILKWLEWNLLWLEHFQLFKSIDRHVVCFESFLDQEAQECNKIQRFLKIKEEIDRGGEDIQPHKKGIGEQLRSIASVSLLAEAENLYLKLAETNGT
ncbi:sulfotransferase [Segetibacter sp. 3557_3]|uniref:sulfotransferase n=1 Tax=Segetibacter sp. 3557_3 TaxID=2547429 RepID=UPI001058EDF8|nr:sulfotransferase [Segetibacter sp. 3557_3]TDH18456.1 sulfotransferase [Segetibacter sp. 3557_3]